MCVCVCVWERGCRRIRSNFRAGRDLIRPDQVVEQVLCDGLGRLIAAEVDCVETVEEHRYAGTALANPFKFVLAEVAVPLRFVPLYADIPRTGVRTPTPVRGRMRVRCTPGPDRVRHQSDCRGMQGNTREVESATLLSIRRATNDSTVCGPSSRDGWYRVPIWPRRRRWTAPLYT